MRKFWLLLSLCALTSCELFQSTEKRTEDRVREQLLGIDWNDVDTYPLFDACDENASKELQRTCFTEHMMANFSEVFQDAKFVVEEDINQTLYVDFKIDEDGFISVLEIGQNEQINALLPNFNEIISKRLNELTMGAATTLKPALKQATPVSMKFRLPLQLNTQN